MTFLKNILAFPQETNLLKCELVSFFGFFDIFYFFWAQAILFYDAFQ